MKRLFAAVKIQAYAPLIYLEESLMNEMAFHRITWVSPENIHITLKFFGETRESDIPEISNILAAAATGFHSFSVELSGLGVFGSRYDPRVIWIGMHGAEPLSLLAKRIADGLKTIGMEPDRQNFVPHLTLGRIKKVTDLKLFQKTMEKYRDIKLYDCKIDKLILFESKLRKEGPEYVIEGEYPFTSL
jgi:RNA 2',3'-cyclic 3'-phosphodiesterase